MHSLFISLRHVVCGRDHMRKMRDTAHPMRSFLFSYSSFFFLRSSRLFLFSFLNFQFLDGKQIEDNSRLSNNNPRAWTPRCLISCIFTFRRSRGCAWPLLFGFSRDPSRSFPLGENQEERGRESNSDVFRVANTNVMTLLTRCMRSANFYPGICQTRSDEIKC